LHYLIKEKKDIDLLIENKIQEGLTIDYKEAFPDLKDSKQKLSFLKDICSFANSHGGQIIYGIKELQGIPISVTNILLDNFDNLNLQFQNIIRMGIEPRFSGITLQLISYSNDVSLLLINIQPSWNVPHRVSFEGHNKFYGRTSGGNYELAITEIRKKFVMMNIISDKIHIFRKQRVEEILEGKFIESLQEGPKILFHIIPLSAFSSTQECSVENLKEVFERTTYMYPLFADPNDSRITLNGFLSKSNTSSNGTHYTCTEFYRKGIVEAVAAIGPVQDNDEKIILSKEYETELVKQKYLKLLQKLNFIPPFYYFISLLDIKDFKLQLSPQGSFPFVKSNNVYHENTILLEEIVVESFDKSQDEILQPAFDKLCNAWGFEKCLHYNPEGSYKF
jgi:hypothetical protein